MLENFTNPLIISILLILFGALLHGITGLGFPMISTMATAIIVPLPIAIAIMVFPNILINMMVLEPYSLKHNNFNKILTICIPYKILIFSSIVGCIIGVFLLKELSNKILYILLAFATLFYVIYSLISSKITLLLDINKNYSKLGMLFFGLVAGIIGGATNAMSSILMMFLLNATTRKTTIVIVSNVCFLFAKLVQLILLQHSFINFTWQQISGIAVISIFSIIILQLGIKIRHRISVKKFRKLVFCILMILSLNSLKMAFL